MKHDEKPTRVEATPREVIEALERIEKSPYSARIRALGRALRGKIVASSLAERGGYLLSFQDGSWVACFLDPAEEKMDFRQGEGAPPPELRTLLDPPGIGDGALPLGIEAPYADEACPMARELRESHGKPVTGVSIGEDSFNLCFPEQRELDAMVLRDRRGRLVLRIFWEQW